MCQIKIVANQNHCGHSQAKYFKLQYRLPREKLLFFNDKQFYNLLVFGSSG